MKKSELEELVQQQAEQIAALERRLQSGKSGLEQLPVIEEKKRKLPENRQSKFRVQI